MTQHLQGAGDAAAGAWLARSGASAAAFRRAEAVLPAGVGSSARGVRAGWSPYPPVLASGSGSRVTDVDGNEYVDYLLGLGPMLLGHCNAEVTGRVLEALTGIGTVLGLP